MLVEGGAARPDYLSIGASFRDAGWTVIAIEPNPEFCAMHRALGLGVLQYACSDEDKDDVDFFLVNSQKAAYLDGNVTFESLSSLGIEGRFAEDLARSPAKPSVSKIKVDVRRLDTILAEHHPEVQTVDLLAVDVEGWELAVMRGFSVEKYRPRVVVLENLFKSRGYRRAMAKLGYTRWKRLKPNEIYVRKNLGPGPFARLIDLFRS